MVTVLNNRQYSDFIPEVLAWKGATQTKYVST